MVLPVPGVRSVAGEDSVSCGPVLRGICTVDVPLLVVTLFVVMSDDVVNSEPVVWDSPEVDVPLVLGSELLPVSSGVVDS